MRFRAPLIFALALLARSARRRATGRDQSHGGRRDHGISAAERLARAPLSGSIQADGHRQRDIHGGLSARGVRRDRDGAPARAPAVQGHRDAEQHSGRDGQARRPVERIDVARSHELLRDDDVEPGESDVGTRARSGPHDAQSHRGKGSLVGDDRRAQRVRGGGERSVEYPARAYHLDRVSLAQLWSLDDRRAIGYRERAHRATAGVLSQVLSARQRGAARRGEIRSGGDASADRRAVRARAASGAVAESRQHSVSHLHGRAHAGWRALGHAATCGRCAGGGRRVPRAGAVAP